MAPRPTMLDRISIIVVIGLFVVAQFGWLPMGIIGGQTRVIPTWSDCGNILCVCAPEPHCPLCGGAPTCTKVDFSDTERKDAVLTSTETIVAVVELPARVQGLVSHAQTPGLSAQVAMSSRTLHVPSPPPRA